ncbi:hypothetical protein [Sphingobacterium yanglingense]|uniref:Uncharacterized protein n=1 Tax=Sphingobacterium yanglingense TaxID=1437280 RepID=A0A4R6WS89_9SPHI|nr:hypothetical protein [Sphingobacterium yanglingense]TDQ79546.1 hypothetical protein CLV99_0989 [Sphingobacterium yanglingense]
MKKYTQAEIEKIHSLQTVMIGALRTVIATSGALHYAAFEGLKPILGDLKGIDKTIPTPQIMDLKRDIEKLIENAEKLHQKIKARFVDPKSQDHFEDISYGIFLCNHALSVKPESEIYQHAFALSGNTKNYQLLTEQVSFFDRVLEKARSSNSDAIKLIQERRDILETINAEPMKVGQDGNVQIYDIAPEREEVLTD